MKLISLGLPFLKGSFLMTTFTVSYPKTNVFRRKKNTKNEREQNWAIYSTQTLGHEESYSPTQLAHGNSCNRTLAPTPLPGASAAAAATGEGKRWLQSVLSRPQKGALVPCSRPVRPLGRSRLRTRIVASLWLLVF